MDLVTTDPDKPVTRQALAIEGRSTRGKVTGKLKVALDAMVWDGKKRDEAATVAGLSVHGLREALKRPHVRAYYKNEIEVLRDNERARNIHTLVEVRDQTSNQMARVQAVKTLEQMSDEADARGGSVSGASASPGVTIRIVNVVQTGHADVHQPVTTTIEGTIDHPGGPSGPASSQRGPGGQNR